MNRQPHQILLLALLAGLVLATSNATFAQGFFPMGGRGLQNLNAAWVQDRGQFSVHAITTSFYQTARLPKSGRAPEFATFWDVYSGLGLHFAATKHTELSLAQTVYQDTHHDDKGANLPDDLYLTAKFGSYGPARRSKIRVGFMTSARFPIAKQHNIILEPYSAGSIELGLLGLLSFSKDVLIPENAFNFHLNLGIWHHNDVGKFLVGSRTDTIAVLDPSRALLWGAGFAIPSHQFDFTLEVYGRNFVVRPPVTAYSREDYAYVTPGVTYRPIYWAALNVGFDIRLSPNIDKTHYIVGLSPVNQELPGYPNWRVRLGARLALNQPAPPAGQKPLFASANGRLVPLQKNLEKQLTEERRKTETAEDELQKIRNERKRMETMLARLRSLLQYGSADQQITEKQDKQDSKAKNGKEGDDPEKN